MLGGAGGGSAECRRTRDTHDDLPGRAYQGEMPVGEAGMSGESG